jgi:2-polyprenyl-3-methyl-5-hydroxy-6-metoxy-1,4-benzoquinol methylase
LIHAAKGTGVGIDPELVNRPALEGVDLVHGRFPDDLPPCKRAFDIATALAVVEHVPEAALWSWAERFSDLVRPGGLLIITVPSPAVDAILHVLIRLRLVSGMEVHQHHGFVPEQLIRIFGAPSWRLIHRSRFQLGLNNLFVFQRADVMGSAFV